jgi:hypothetical protein
VLKRLVIIKEYKKFYVVKGNDSQLLAIEAPATKPTGVTQNTAPEG